MNFVAFGDSKSLIPDVNAKKKKNPASDGSSSSAAPVVEGLILLDLRPLTDYSDSLLFDCCKFF